MELMGILGSGQEECDDDLTEERKEMGNDFRYKIAYDES